MSTLHDLAPDRGIDPGVERLLVDAIGRLARRPQDWVMLVLHLSRLRPPAPRPHHRRVARVILHDVAERHAGQLFGLRNGDLALLCHTDALRPQARGAVLADTLARLLRVDAPNPSQVISLWHLDRDRAVLDTYVTERLEDAAPPVVELPDRHAPIGPRDSVAADADIAARGRRQMGVEISGSTLRPIFRKIGFATAALQDSLGMAAASDGDPDLVRHFAARLDHAVVQQLTRALGTGSPLDATAPGPVLHLTITPAAILSDGFAPLAAACKAGTARLGIDVALLDMVADARGFTRARHVLDRAGIHLAIDGVSHLALQLSAPEVLDVGCLKLDWSPHLLALSDADRSTLAVTLRRIGPARIVLQRADGEAALRWGLAQGIRRFQGRHVDAMLAAGRMLACAAAGGCTLGQCVDRAAATGTGTHRHACRNLPLLDAGAAP